MRITTTAALLLATSPALASGTIYYGSRVGMEVSVVSMSGLGTANAVIVTKHTREDATGFCRDYVGEVTEKCIREELETRLNDQIEANCQTGEFTDFEGNRYRFSGFNKHKDESSKYRIVDLATGQVEDGTTASGYGTNMGILQALCPNRVTSLSQDWYKETGIP